MGVLMWRAPTYCASSTNYFGSLGSAAGDGVRGGLRAPRLVSGSAEIGAETGVFWRFQRLEREKTLTVLPAEA